MRPSLLACLILLGAAAPASAQLNQAPIPPVEFDMRAVMGLLGHDVTTTSSLGASTPSDLPGLGLGFVIGVNTYPIRKGGFALGLGGEYLRASVNHTPVNASGTPLSPEIQRRLQSASGQLSFNFGHRLGWSYLTGGMGPLQFDTQYKTTTATASTAATSGGTTSTNFISALLAEPIAFNYGGGGRWFVSNGVALSLDLRFYRAPAADAAPPIAARFRHKITVFSIGIAIKCDDGAGRAAEVMMAATLERFLPGDADRAALEPLVRPTLRNWNGIAVGSLRPTEVLTS